ncbi:MAG: hypothetical protein AVDCRST_MAG01-01-5334 [uncultured Rubrobacteraceae bacterium]|uniref:Uncharacterized protein n=1 Tax=uncultured Rubrobacteraceae bacterium TaxID=349277 RepID=A0A6J4R4I8_9ACTN|nr:MAG: hypothetical protein AVDCRST_MAG01-01-5334 [uncultured Rubrobacteraceae bacterium]
MDHEVRLARQRVELLIAHPEQGLAEIPDDRHHAVHPACRYPVGFQVGGDGLERVLIAPPPDEAVDPGLRRREQPFEEKGPEKARGTRQKDVFGLGRSDHLYLAFRRDIRLEDGLGAKVELRSRSGVAVALEGFDPVAQASYGRVFHKERHRDVDAESLFDLGREPGGGERVTAEVEEVVSRLDLTLVQAEYLLPDALEQVLLLRARRVGGERRGLQVPLGAGLAGRGLREPPAVHLARGRLDRERVERHVDRGNGVVGQYFPQDAPDLLAPARLGVEAPAGEAVVVLRFGDHVGDEALVLALVALGDHHARPDGDVLLDGRLHRAELDVVAPDPDPEVRPAEDLQVPVRQDASPVAGPVHPRPVLPGERVGHEALGGLLRQVHEAPGEHVPPDDDLAGLPFWHPPEVVVQDVQALRSRGQAHRAVRRTRTIHCFAQLRHRDLVGLGDAVEVEGAGVGQRLEQAPRQRLGDHLAADPDRLQVGEALGEIRPAPVEDRLSEGRSHLDLGDAVLFQVPHQGRGIVDHIVPDDVRGPAPQERPQHLPHEKYAAPDPVPHPVVADPVAPQVREHRRPVRVRDALRLARGPRRVGYEGQVLPVHPLRRGIFVGRPRLVHIHPEALLPVGQTPGVGVFGEDEGGLAVGEDVLQLRRRVGELQGHVRAAGLHGGQDRHYVLRATLHVHADGRVRRDADAPQVGGEHVGPPVQFRVGQRGIRVHHGGRIRGLLRLAFEEFMQAEVPFVHAGSTVRPRGEKCPSVAARAVRPCRPRCKIRLRQPWKPSLCPFPKRPLLILCSRQKRCCDLLRLRQDAAEKASGPRPGRRPLRAKRPGYDGAHSTPYAHQFHRLCRRYL